MTFSKECVDYLSVSAPGGGQALGSPLKKQRVRRLEKPACQVADKAGRTILMRALELEFQKCGTSFVLVATDALCLASCELKAELLRRLESKPKERALLQVRLGPSYRMCVRACARKQAVPALLVYLCLRARGRACACFGWVGVLCFLRTPFAGCAWLNGKLVCNPLHLQAVSNALRELSVLEGGRKGGPQELKHCPFFWLASCVVELSTIRDLFRRCARSLSASCSTCAATCISIVYNVVRAIQGGLCPPSTAPLLRLHSP
jgi:hypothetical protein